MRNRGLIIGIILIIIVFVILSNKTPDFIPDSEQKPDFIPDSEQKIVENCKNLDLFKTSECLTNNIKTFYKYNESQRDEKDSNFSDLLINGGVCNDWAKLYERLGKQLNFVSLTLPFDRDNDGKNDHRITILSDKKDYCILDQTTYWCKNLK